MRSYTDARAYNSASPDLRDTGIILGMNKILCVPLLLGLLLPARAAGAEYRELREVPGDFWNGFKQQGSSEGVAILLGAGALAATARFGERTYFDDFSAEKTLDRRRPLGTRATDFGAVAGFPGFHLLGMGAAYFTGKFLDAEGVQEFGLVGAEAIVLAGVQTELLKMSVRRVRPDRTNLAAFPSGHTSGSFALASVAASKWGWKAGVPAYLAAGFVGYTRMEARKHYLSDVIFGAGLGIVSGRAVYQVRRRGHPDRYTVMPFASPGGGGIRVLF